eukprot:gene785-873_t
MNPSKVAPVNAEEQVDVPPEETEAAKDIEAAKNVYDADNDEGREQGTDEDEDDHAPLTSKELQSHHDDIDRQIQIQNDMLKNLQDSLTKEVYELKNLLASTAMQIGSSGGEGDKAKRIKGLLEHVKADVSCRDIYETNISSTEDRITQALRQLQHLLDAGATAFAENVCEQLSDAAVRAVDNEEHNESLESPALHEMMQELENIRLYVTSSLIQAINDEDRRSLGAAQVFEMSLRNSRSEFPMLVLDGMRRCADLNVEADGATNDLVNAYKSFAEQTPKFVNAMTAAETTCGRQMLSAADAGNPSLMAREKSDGIEAMSNYLDDLRRALITLLDMISERKLVCRQARDAASSVRRELLGVIDEFLTTPTLSSDINLDQLLPALLQALREERSAKDASPRSSSDVVDQYARSDVEEHDDSSNSHVVEIPERVSEVGAEDEVTDFVPLPDDDVDVPDKLVTLPEISADHSVKAAMSPLNEDEDGEREETESGDEESDNEIDRSEGSFEDLKDSEFSERDAEIKAELLSANIRVEEEVEHAIAAENAIVEEKLVQIEEENELLNDSIMEIRGQILDDKEVDAQIIQNIMDLEMKRQESAMQQALNFVLSETPLQDDNRDISLKHIDEQELLEEQMRQNRELKLAEALRIDADAYTISETVEVASSPDLVSKVSCLADIRSAVVLRCAGASARLKYHELALEVYVQNFAEHKFVNESDDLNRMDDSVGADYITLERMLVELSADVTSNRLKLERDCIDRKDAWLSSPDQVNVELESKLLAEEVYSQFLEMRSIAQHLVEAVRHKFNSGAAARRRSISERVDPASALKYSSALNLEIDKQTESLEAFAENELQVLLTEESLLTDMLHYSTAWGPEVDERQQQSHLHQRVLVGLQSRQQDDTRRRCLEADLGSMLQEFIIVKRSRYFEDKESVREDISNTRRRSREGRSELMQTLSVYQDKERSTEERRQADALVDYNRERTIAVESNGYQLVYGMIEAFKSKRTLFTQLLSARNDLLEEVLGSIKSNHLLELDNLRESSMMEFNRRLALFGDRRTPTDEANDELNVFRQKVAGALADAETRFLDELCNAFKEFLAKTAISQRVDEELNNILRIQQIESELNEESDEVRMANDLLTLRSQQVKRREEVDRTRKVLEQEMVGLEAQLQKRKKDQLALMEENLKVARQKTLQNLSTEGKDFRSVEERDDESAKAQLAQLSKDIDQGIESEMKSVMDEKDDALRRLREDHEKYLKSLDGGLESLRATEKASMKKRLLERKAARVRELLSQGYSSADAEEIAMKEYLEAKESGNAAIDDRLTDTVDRIRERFDDDYENKSKSLREEHERNLEMLAASLRSKKDLEAKALRERIEAKRLARLKELQSQGYSREEADRISRREAEDLYEVELAAAAKKTQEETDEELGKLRERFDRDMERLNEELRVKKEKDQRVLRDQLAARRRKRERELIQDGLSEEEARNIASEEFYEEERRESEDLKQKLETEEKEQAARLKADYLKEEARFISIAHARAREEADNAEEEKKKSYEKLQELKRLRAAEESVLNEELAAKHARQEKSLKAKLANSRKLKLEELEARQASANQIAAVKAELDRQEVEAVERLRKEMVKEKQQQMSSKLKKHATNIAKAVQETKIKDANAAAFAAKTLALQAAQEMKEREEKEALNAELRRKREEMSKEEERLNKIQQLGQTYGQNRLEQRLAAKRLKREKELRLEEEEMKAELVAKQAVELQDQERLKRSRLMWMDRLKEASLEADNMELIGLEKEDYCLKETLGKGIVPPAQLSEAVARVQSNRHTSQMRDLLSAHFNERVEALREAVSGIYEEKSTKREQLIRTLGEEGANEERISLELAKLDKEYDERRRAAEQSVSESLEVVHTQAQLELRQTQLLESSDAIRFYCDEKTMLALSEGASPDDQSKKFKEYKERLERENLERKFKLEEERKAMEARLREEHEKLVSRLREQLLVDQAREEEEIERKRQQLLRQKEENESKHALAKVEMQAQEKNRILSEFEKESAAREKAKEDERKSKRTKLQNRLAAKKAERKPQLEAKAELEIVIPKDPSSKVISSVDANKDSVKSPSAPVGETKAELLNRMKFRDSVKAVLRRSTNNLVAGSGDRPDAGYATGLARSIQLIEAKLDKIDKVMSQLELSQAKILEGGTNTGLGTSTEPTRMIDVENERRSSITAQRVSSSFYQDMDDPAQGDELIVVSEDDLHERETARLLFAKQLSERVGLKNLTIKPVKSLPPSSLFQNAFRNSYTYVEISNTLYIHLNRFLSSGDIGLVTIHALSHIKVNAADLSNDLDPLFISEFHKNLRILSQDLFSASLAGSSISPLPRVRPVSVSLQAGVDNYTSRPTAAIDESLGTLNFGDQSISTPSTYFDPVHLHDRLRRYAAEGGVSVETVDRYLNDLRSRGDGSSFIDGGVGDS